MLPLQAESTQGPNNLADLLQYSALYDFHGLNERPLPNQDSADHDKNDNLNDYDLILKHHPVASHSSQMHNKQNDVIEEEKECKAEKT